MAAESRATNGATSDAGGESPDSNPWDDTLLIKAYDHAVNLAKRNLDKLTPDSPFPKTVPSKKSEQPQNEVKTDVGKSDDPKSNKPETMRWKRGMYCRCEYSADGIEYEAEIASIKNNKAVVRYIGYNNEETVPLCRLSLSHGPAVRQLQSDQSKVDQAGAAAMEEEVSGLFEGSVPTPQIMANGMVLPPPPPSLMGRLSQTEEEALSAMLMSWYMSGFHTGYYQGLKAASGYQTKK